MRVFAVRSRPIAGFRGGEGSRLSAAATVRAPLRCGRTASPRALAGTDDLRAAGGAGAIDGEEVDEDGAGDEAADVGEVGDAAAGAGDPRAGGGGGARGAGG